MHTRPLTSFERMITLMDDQSPQNVVVALHLTPAPKIEPLREALFALQARHPALRARIDSAGEYRFIYDVDCPIPLEEMVGDLDDWQGIVEKRLALPLGGNLRPLVHATAVTSPKTQGGILIFAFHHAIMDGKSAAPLLNELLCHLAGYPSSEPPTQPTPDIQTLFPAAYQGRRKIAPLLRFLGRQMKEEAIFTVRSIKHRALPVPKTTTCRILTATLPEESTRMLIQRARQQQLTLNSVLNAALTLASNQVIFDGRQGPLRMITFADLRPYLEPSLDIRPLGNAISMLRISDRFKPGDTLWTFAGRIQNQFTAAFRRGDKFAAFLLADRLIQFILKISRIRLSTTALSYTGNLGLPEIVGPYRLTGLNAFISNNRIGPVMSAQVQLFRDELVVDMLYMEPEVSEELAKLVMGEMERLLCEGR